MVIQIKNWKKMKNEKTRIHMYIQCSYYIFVCSTNYVTLTTKKTLMALFVSSIGKKYVAEAIGSDLKA